MADAVGYIGSEVGGICVLPGAGTITGATAYGWAMSSTFISTALTINEIWNCFQPNEPSEHKP